MNKIDKNEIVNSFRYLNDDELIDTIYELCIYCNSISMSEKEAEKWLDKYGIKFYYQHQKEKNQLKKLLMYAKITHLEIPFELSINDYDENSVIERILENQALIVTKLEETADTNVINALNYFYEIIVDEYKKSVSKKLSNER